MEILLIKTTDETSKLVLDNNLYYSHGLPRRKFSAVLILGKSRNGEIPVLAECDVIKIDRTKAVNSNFVDADKDWEYEWDLQINKTFKPIKDLLKCVKQTAHKHIKHCEGISYIDFEDINTNLYIGKNVTYVLTREAEQFANSNKSKNIITKPNIVTPIINTVELEKKFTVGQNIKIKYGQGLKIKNSTAKIISIQNVYQKDTNENEVLVDQKIEVDLSGVRKKYLASQI